MYVGLINLSIQGLVTVPGFRHDSIVFHGDHLRARGSVVHDDVHSCRNGWAIGFRSERNERHGVDILDSLPKVVWHILLVVCLQFL